MSQPQPPQRGFIYWRDLALHTLPVATVLGFLAVIVFLNSVFGIWGLSVAQLVTPGDTIVPGVILGILLVALFMFAFIPGTLLDPILKKMPMPIRPYALAGVVAASAVFWIPNGVGGFGVKFVATLIALGCAMHPFLNRHDFEKIPHMAKAATVVVFAPAAVWLTLAFTEAPKLFAASGFMSGASIEKQEGVPCDARVLWLGERAVVFRCTAPEGDIWVATTTEGLVFRPSASSA